MLTSCSSCLKAFQCGWLYDFNDPRIGWLVICIFLPTAFDLVFNVSYFEVLHNLLSCVNGDFSGPNDGCYQNFTVMIKRSFILNINSIFYFLFLIFKLDFIDLE